MTIGLLVAVALISALAGMALTARLVPALEAARVLDVPNDRSLHDRAVPRGGGLAIAAVVLAVLGALLAAGRLDVAVGGTALLAGAGFAALGWFDDREDKPTWLRLAAQGALAGAAILVTVHGGGLPPLVGAGLAVAVVWHVNLFNFMDGSDGFACAQAACAGLGYAALLGMDGRIELAVWAAAIGGATIGFARWNWPPARVFLGDAGSYFLGFNLALLPVLAWLDGLAPWPYVVLLAPFVTDASLTLGRRALTGHAFWRAHRDHAYQRAILAGLAPARLAFRLGSFLVVVCAPAAWFARGSNGAWIALSVYGLTGMIWLWVQRSRPVLRPS